MYESERDIKIVTSFAGEQNLYNYVQTKKDQQKQAMSNKQKKDSSKILMEAMSFKSVIPEVEIKELMKKLLTAVA